MVNYMVLVYQLQRGDLSELIIELWFSNASVNLTFSGENVKLLAKNLLFSVLFCLSTVLCLVKNAANINWNYLVLF